MRLAMVIGVALLLGACTSRPTLPTLTPVAPPPASVAPSSPSPAATPTLVAATTSPDLAAQSIGPCAATSPNGATPPNEEVHDTYHGNGKLFVALWPEGRVLIRPADVRGDGLIGMKFPWWRGPGVVGTLTIEARRLDATSPPATPQVPDGYGDTGFQASGVYFPSLGCWEITGRAADAELTFVAIVTLDPAAW